MKDIFKNRIFWIAIIIIVVILYFVLKEDEKVVKAKAPNNCPSMFTIHPSSNTNLVSTTYTFIGGKYYSEISGGGQGFSGSLKPDQISEADFLEACDKYKKANP